MSLKRATHTAQALSRRILTERKKPRPGSTPKYRRSASCQDTDPARDVTRLPHSLQNRAEVGSRAPQLRHVNVGADITVTVPYRGTNDASEIGKRADETGSIVALRHSKRSELERASISLEA